VVLKDMPVTLFATLKWTLKCRGAARVFLTLTAVGGLTLAVAGCGVRGSLDAPPHAQAAGTAKSAEAAGTQPGSAAPPKPHESFILDPLLR
jgi:predicted small lipoprotein YifL